ncbi:MAG: PAS domain-containing protein, partial [Desulfobacteraceae bacterium]|nr:PAS domain-containing protein [Desulfobacteraceae bacterium]
MDSILEKKIKKITDDYFWQSEELKARNEEMEAYAKILVKQKKELEDANQKLKSGEQLKAINRQLQASEKQLKAILTAIPDPLVMYNDHGEPEYMNKAFTDIFEWSLDELKGRRIPFVPEDEKKITGQMLSELLSTKEKVQFETKRLTKQGRSANVIVSASCIKNSHDAVSKIVVVIKDITKEKKMQARIQEESDNFNNVYNNAFSAIFTIDGDIFIDCNQALVNMLNADDKTQVLNTHPSQLSPEMQPDGRTSFEKANEMIAVAYDKGFNNFEWIHKKITGEEFPVDVSLTRVNFKGKPVLHCLWKDLSK